jgi:hypothetical protein
VGANSYQGTEKASRHLDCESGWMYELLGLKKYLDD